MHRRRLRTVGLRKSTCGENYRTRAKHAMASASQRVMPRANWGYDKWVRSTCQPDNTTSLRPRACRLMSCVFIYSEKSSCDRGQKAQQYSHRVRNTSTDTPASRSVAAHLNIVAVPREAIDEKPRKRWARLHGLLQQPQADRDGHDATFPDVLINQLAIARSALTLLPQQLPRRQVNIPILEGVFRDAYLRGWRRRRARSVQNASESNGRPVPMSTLLEFGVSEFATCQHVLNFRSTSELSSLGGHALSEPSTPLPTYITS